MMNPTKLLCAITVVVCSFDDNAEEYIPPRFRVPWFRALAAHESHGLSVPVPQQVDRNAAWQPEDNAVLTELEIMVTKISGDQVLLAMSTPERDRSTEKTHLWPYDDFFPFRRGLEMRFALLPVLRRNAVLRTKARLHSY